jgi:hypothetical protein
MNDDTEHNAADAAEVDNAHHAPLKGRAELVFVPGKRPEAAERKKPPAAVTTTLPSALADGEPDARQLMLPSVPPPPPRVVVELPEPAVATKRTRRAPAAARTASSTGVDSDDEFCAYAMRIGADRAYALLAEFFDPYLGRGDE